MIDPTQQAAQPAAAPGAAGGTVVCIAAQPDGTFTVYPEGQDAAAGQPFQDIDQALEAAETMLTGQGDGDGSQGSASNAEAEADAMFKGGFAQARGTPLNRGDQG